ncbi:MAG: hypothetical protein CMP10_09775 [Zetaproteobacteria bacterium]|nr:hypothetical protein [Pseudobdellovibrionaceae bacterium]
MNRISTKIKVSRWLAGLLFFLPVLSLPFIFSQYNIYWDDLLKFRWLELSLISTGSVTFFTIILGLFLGWVLGHEDRASAKWLTILSLLPLTIPGWFQGMIWSRIFDLSSFALSPLFQYFWVQVIDLTPWSFMLFYSYFRFQPRFEEEFLCSLGISKKWRLIKIQLPRLLVPILSSVIIIGLQVWSDYSVAAWLGLRTLSVAVQDLWLSFDRPAAALAPAIVLLVGVILLLLSCSLWLSRWPRNHNPNIMYGSKRNISDIQSSSNFWLLGLCFFYPLISYVIPIGTLVFWWIDHPQAGVQPLVLWPQIYMLLLQGFGTVIGVGCLVYWGHRFINHRGFPSFLQVMAIVSFGVPAVMVGISVLYWSLNGIFGLELLFNPVYSILPLIWALMVRYAVFPVFFVTNGQKRLSRGYERMASVYGLNRWDLWTRFQGPLVFPFLFVGLLLTFLGAIQDLDLVLMLQPYGYDTLTLNLYQMASLDLLPATALRGGIFVLFSLYPVLTIGRWLTREL